MLRSQRLKEIVRIISSQDTISVDELVTTLDISPATARRDLDLLAQEGQVVRTRGGASSISDEPFAHSRTKEKAPEKRAIAQACRRFLQPGATVGLTGGSTVLEVAKVMVQWANEKTPPHNTTSSPILTVVTNAMNIAMELSRCPSIKIIVLGGELNKNSLEITGPSSLLMLKQLWCDVSFIGVNGFDEKGPGTADEYEAHTNQAMVNNTTLPIIVTDSTKFGKSSFANLGDTTSIRTVVTDAGIPPNMRQHLDNENYDVIITTPEE